MGVSSSICPRRTSVEQQASVQSVVAYYDAETSPVRGKVTFERTASGILVRAQLTGLGPGLHGLHIHTLGDPSLHCSALGGHFNPAGHLHGSPDDDESHVGDLGNLVADDTGRAMLADNDGNAISERLCTKLAFEGAHNIIGRGLVVHELPDDLGRGGTDTSSTTGSAGARIACAPLAISSQRP